MTRILLLSMLLCGALIGPATRAGTGSGAVYEAEFDQANRLYEEGRFVEAIQAYLPLRTNCPTVAVHFNLGNAYFKSGQLGQAVAEYHEAARLAPRDPDVRANLRFAAARVPGPSYQPGRAQETAKLLTGPEWALAASGAIWLFCLLQVVRQVAPGWRAGLRAWTIASGILAAGLIATAAWASRVQAQDRIAVVTQREAVMRFGPFEEAQSALELKGGAVLRVLDRKAEWIQATVGRQQLGWVPADAVRVIDP